MLEAEKAEFAVYCLWLDYNMIIHEALCAQRHCHTEQKKKEAKQNSSLTLTSRLSQFSCNAYIFLLISPIDWKKNTENFVL